MSEDDFKTIAWRDFIVFAFGEPKLRDQFTRETGLRLPEASRSPIECLIDDATNATLDAYREFIKWATVNHWGLDDAPKAYREILAKRTTTHPTGECEEGL